MNWQAPLIPPLATSLELELRARIDHKTKPLGSLGRLEEIALRCGLMQATLAPEWREPTVRGGSFEEACRKFIWPPAMGPMKIVD